MILSFDNPDKMREEFINSFNSLDASIYPINLFFAHYFVNKDYSFLKNFVSNNDSTSLTKKDYDYLISNNCIDKTLASQFIENNSNYTYFYLGSYLSFCNSFSSFLPSVLEAIFNNLISNNYISFLKFGRGNVILISPSLFDCDFSSFKKSFSPSDAVQNVLDHINLLNDDNSYLIQKIYDQQEYIDYLKNEILLQKRNNFIQSQTTWR